tara:strand:- start:7915 stop:9081 length:1167 start_codon:yes stop_codon:yes gene_type:complete
MAYYFLFPEKDTTLYSHPDRSKMNSGYDEILEVVKERGSDDQKFYPSRALIKFKNEEIQNLISDTIGHSTFNNSTSKVNLELVNATSKNLNATLNLNVFAVSQSWDEGTGRYSNLPTSSNGASWIYRNNTTVSTEWLGVTASNFAAGTTGSITSLLTQGGANWYTSSGFTSTQQFLAGVSLDTDFDVTDIVKKHSASLFNNSTYPTGAPNNGFIIKKPEIIESDTGSAFGDLQYFSSNTHTIYPPKLSFKWDDSSYADSLTGSAKYTGDLNVSLYRNKEEYNQNDEATFRVHVRDKYPTRQFASSSNFLNAGYFTTASYYSIRDAHTEREIIPFDTNFTKLSADSEGMYFKIYMKGLQPERYYRVLFKHTNNEGTTIYDDNYYFKIIR